MKQDTYTMTDEIVGLVAEISQMTGSLSATNPMPSNPRLHRDSRIRTLHASLAIANNSLSLEQVADIVNGRRILGAPREIQEVKNAYEAYSIACGRHKQNRDGGESSLFYYFI